jgi:hypothetical protein
MLRHHISRIIMSTDLAYLHQTFLNDITNEVIMNINMLGFLNNHLIFGEINNTLTITINGNQKRAQTFEIGYSKIQNIKEISALMLFCVIHY